MTITLDGIGNERPFSPENQDFLNTPPTPHRTFEVALPAGPIKVEEYILAGQARQDDGSMKTAWKLFWVKEDMLLKVIDSDGRQAPLFQHLLYSPAELDKARIDLMTELERYYRSGFLTVSDYNEAVRKGKV